MDREQKDGLKKISVEVIDQYIEANHAFAMNYDLLNKSWKELQNQSTLFMHPLQE